MKKFFFSLNTVLNYKEQVLESLRGEESAGRAGSEESSGKSGGAVGLPQDVAADACGFESGGESI